MSKQLVIAGFHRSGTSATAQLLHRAGLFLGYELLEPLPSNPYGHFEDREVVNLHQEILADNDRTWLVGEPLLPVVSGARWARARGMIERRNAEHALWGFKDPRACLFLMIWKYLLPDMKVLLVYRHFSESTHSLGRRHSSDLFMRMGNPRIHRRFWEEPDLALRMWLVHNEVLLAFARAYPEDTLAVSMDMIRDGFPLVHAVNEMRKEHGLALTGRITLTLRERDRDLLMHEEWIRAEVLATEIALDPEIREPTIRPRADARGLGDRDRCR